MTARSIGVHSCGEVEVTLCPDGDLQIRLEYASDNCNWAFLDRDASTKLAHSILAAYEERDAAAIEAP